MGGKREGQALGGKKTHGLGKAFSNQAKKRGPTNTTKHVSETPFNGLSVLEQTSLDDYLTTAELAQQNFTALNGTAQLAEEAKVILEKKREADRAKLGDVVVPIPRRPRWEDLTAEALQQAENDAFLAWRRELAELEEEVGAVMTPYEKNVDFWRQLWRVVERSDVVVQIIDARAPLFYRSPDLEAYVTAFPRKKAMLVLNKADFLSPEQRAQWSSYFKERNIKMVFFSALAELQRKNLLYLGGTSETNDDDLGVPHGSLERADDVLDCDALLALMESHADGNQRATIGMVGYPNVGKSSLINAVVGEKKVSMSRQPGKTKHFQTIEVPERNITLCDCPGLVFPSVVATKAHLVIRGVQPIDVVPDTMGPVELIVDRVGLEEALDYYRCAEQAAPFRHESAARTLLSAMAVKLGHFLRLKEPDLSWSARRILRDFNSGDLLHVETPPGMAAPACEELPDADEAAERAFMAAEGVADVGEFLGEGEADPTMEEAVAKMSKRKMRQMMKGMHRGKIQMRVDGSLDPFTNHEGSRVGSVGLGLEAMRLYQTGKR
jgi:large subunit GTPase 1